MPIFNNPQLDTTAQLGPSLWDTLISGLGAMNYQPGGAGPTGATPTMGGAAGGIGATMPTPPTLTRPANALVQNPYQPGAPDQPTGAASNLPGLTPGGIGATSPTPPARNLPPNAMVNTPNLAGPTGQSIVNALGQPEAGADLSGVPGAVAGMEIPQTGLTRDLGRALKDFGDVVSAPRRFGEDIGKKIGEYAFKPIPKPGDWDPSTGDYKVLKPTEMDPSQAKPADTEEAGGGAPGGAAGGAAGAGGAGGAAPTKGGFSVPGPQEESYVQMTKRIEGMGFNPRSTAGPEGLTDPMFKDYLKANHPEIQNPGKLTRQQLDKLKVDNADDATQWYAAKVVTPALIKANIPVDKTTLYAGHFLGPGGVVKLYTASDNTPVAQILSPEAIGKNPEALSGKTVGEVKAWINQKTHILPQQPQLGAPPMQAQVPPTDFSNVRRMLAQASISPQEQTANILAGLAGGAGSVAANAPGSFASALAAMGAGGAKAYAGNYATQRAVMQARAESEMRMLSTSHAEAKEASEVAFQNAKNAWDVANTNAERQYKGTVAEREFLQPKVEAKGDNLVVTQYNANTGRFDVQAINTKNAIDQAEARMKILKGTGAEGPAAEAEAVKGMIQQYGSNPEVLHTVMRGFLIKKMISDGAGTVFGKNYLDAVKKAGDDLGTQYGTALKDTKPEVYGSMLNDRVAALLLNDPKLVQNEKIWLEQAAQQGSVTARILAGKPTLTPEHEPPKATPATAKPKKKENEVAY